MRETASGRELVLKPLFGSQGAGLRRLAGVQELPPPEEKEPAHDLDYLTNFERKARKQGVAINRAVIERTSGPATLAADPLEVS